MERILFGDNQFFGINHMSEEKARQQAMRFQEIDNIVEVLQQALQAGAGGFMCTTHDTIERSPIASGQIPSRGKVSRSIRACPMPTNTPTR